MRIVESNRRRNNLGFQVVFDNITLDLDASFSLPTSISDISSNADFSKLYISTNGTTGNPNIYELNHNNLNDISQATLGTSFSIASDNRAIHADSLNSKLYVGRSSVYEIDLNNTTLSSSTYTGRSFAVTNSMRTLRMNNDLSKMLFIDNNNDVKEYNFGTNGDVSTLSDSTKTFTTSGGNPDGMDILNNKLLILSSFSPSVVREYKFSSIYDISSLSSTGNIFNPQQSNLDGVLIIPTTKKILIAGNKVIEQYSYTNV